MSNGLVTTAIPEILVGNRKDARRYYKQQIKLAERQQIIDVGTTLLQGGIEFVRSAWTNEIGQTIIGLTATYGLFKMQLLPGPLAGPLSGAILGKFIVGTITDPISEILDAIFPG